MNAVLPKFFKGLMPALVGGAIGALAVAVFRDDRVAIADPAGGGEMRIIRVDGAPAERRTRRFLMPTTPHTLVSPGKRSLTVSMSPSGQGDPHDGEWTMEVHVYKGMEYRLGTDQKKMPILVVTKI